MSDNKQLEETFRKYLEQKNALLQALERVEGALITLNNILNPEQHRELLGGPKPVGPEAKPEKEVVEEVKK